MIARLIGFALFLGAPVALMAYVWFQVSPLLAGR